MAHKRREELFAAARGQFLKRGFRTARLDEILSSCDMPRRMVYYHYESKDGLMAAVLEDYSANWLRWFLAAAESHGASGAECLDAFFRVLRDWVSDANHEGCLALHALTEFSEADGPMHALAAGHFDAIRKFFEHHARGARAAHPTILARQLLCIAQGILLQAQAGNARIIARDGRLAAKLLINDAEP